MAIKPIKRRHFLGGAGTALALPLLEAMLPVGKTAFAQGANPTRMLFYFLPMILLLFSSSNKIDLESKILLQALIDF